MAPAKKGGASMRRVGGLADADVVGSFDDPETRAALTKADKARDAAYRQGQAAAKRRVQETGRTRGHQAARVHEDPEHQELYESGFGHELGDQRKQRRSDTVKPIAEKAGGIAHDGAGVVLGLIAYALFLAYVKNGVPGVTGWLSAKFLNRTTQGATPTPQNPGGFTNNDKTGNEAWIAAHLGQWPHPGAGSSDFWNAIAQMRAQAAGVAMQGKP